VSAPEGFTVDLPVVGQTSFGGKACGPARLQLVHRGGEWFVVVFGTPGRWRARGLLDGSSGPLAIDYGRGWILENADEIRAWLRADRERLGL
jgi:hypothetical protein